MLPRPFNGGYTIEDPDIQFLYKRRLGSEAVHCQLCPQDLDKYSIKQRQQHYQLHFEGEQGESSSSTPINPRKQSTPSNTKPPEIKTKWGEKMDIFWYPAQIDNPPKNFSPGLIPIIKKALIKSHEKGKTRRAVLCYERVVHVSREQFDRQWGCGYRNFLMACTSLMDQPYEPMYFPLLDAPISPGVRNLQTWIEEAWKAGFDKEGAMELKKLIGKSKWIGTSDLWVAFTYRGIPAELVDFDLKKNPKGVQAVIEWVVEYFSYSNDRTSSNNVNDALRGASAVTVSNRMPLILQHDGHSRTIVGYEIMSKGAINLLVFDPSCPPTKEIRRVALANLTSSLPTSSSLSPQPKKSHSPLSQSVREFLHSIPGDITDRKRCASDSSGKGREAKRSRSDSQESDIEIIGHSKEASDCHEIKQPSKAPQKNLDHEGELTSTAILNHFRLDSKKLGKKAQYQILYFPMVAPLTEQERMSRMEVISTKVM